VISASQLQVIQYYRNSNSSLSRVFAAALPLPLCTTHLVGECEACKSKFPHSEDPGGAIGIDGTGNKGRA